MKKNKRLEKIKLAIAEGWPFIHLRAGPFANGEKMNECADYLHDNGYHIAGFFSDFLTNVIVFEKDKVVK